MKSPLSKTQQRIESAHVAKKCRCFSQKPGKACQAAIRKARRGMRKVFISPQQFEWRGKKASRG